MSASPALRRSSSRLPTQDLSASLDPSRAHRIAMDWMSLMASDHNLSEATAYHSGIVPWQTSPAGQIAMAATLSSRLVHHHDRVFVVGTSVAPWVRSAAPDGETVMRIYLGKILPTNVIPATADDVITHFESSSACPTIIAFHASTSADWQTLRQITSAAVKSETPTLILITADSDAPKGAVIERVSVASVEAMTSMVTTLEDALSAVREQGAIRVISIDDTTPSAVENVMMLAASLSPAAWQAQMAERMDAGERAASNAYASAVETF